MNFETLTNDFKNWAEWYNIELSNKRITMPYISNGNINYLDANAALVHYCGYTAVKINKYLRDGEYNVNAVDRTFEFSLYSTAISFIMATTPKINKSFSAYRYISKTELDAITQSKSTYLKKDFLSVTLDKKLHEKTNSEEYVKTDYMLELQIPGETHAIIPSLLHKCGRSFEQELILPKDAYIIYTGQSRIENGKTIYSCLVKYFNI